MENYPLKVRRQIAKERKERAERMQEPETPKDVETGTETSKQENTRQGAFVRDDGVQVGGSSGSGAVRTKPGTAANAAGEEEKATSGERKGLNAADEDPTCEGSNIGWALVATIEQQAKATRAKRKKRIPTMPRIAAESAGDVCPEDP